MIKTLENRFLIVESDELYLIERKRVWRTKREDS